MELKFYQQNKIKLENAILFSSDEIITTFQSIQRKNCNICSKNHLNSYFKIYNIIDIDNSLIVEMCEIKQLFYFSNASGVKLSNN